MSQYVSTQRTRNGLTRLDVNDYYDDIEIEKLYQWIDRIPLTRPRKNLGKDFSDGASSMPSPSQDFPPARLPRSPQRGLSHSYPQSPQGLIPHGHPTRVAYSTARPAVHPELEQVSRSLLEERELESLAKDETIMILQAKLKRLEHLLQLKDLRIEDLQSRLSAPPSPSASCNTTICDVRVTRSPPTRDSHHTSG